MPPMSAEGGERRLEAEGREEPSATLSPTNSTSKTDDIESLKAQIENLKLKLVKRDSITCQQCGHLQQQTTVHPHTTRHGHKATTKHKIDIRTQQDVMPSNKSNFKHRPPTTKPAMSKHTAPNGSTASSNGPSISEVANIIKEQTNQIKSLKSLVQKQSEIIRTVLKQPQTSYFVVPSQINSEATNADLDLDDSLNPETLMTSWSEKIGLSTPGAPHSAPTISPRTRVPPRPTRRMVPRSSANLRTCPVCLKCFPTAGEKNYEQHVMQCAEQKFDNNNSTDSIKCSSITDDRPRKLRAPERCPYCSTQFTCHDCDNGEFAKHLQLHEQTIPPPNDFVLL